VNEVFEQFLARLDEALCGMAQPGEHLDLYQLGSAALIMHHSLKRLTRDFDIVMMRTPLESRAVELFGKGSPNAATLGVYLELVPQGAPPLPQWYNKRSVAVPGPWKLLRVWRPQPADLAATKLKCYRPQDREDLKFLCDQRLVTAEGLRQSLESAFIWVHEKDDDPGRDRAFANLAKVIDYLEGRSRTL
jgi:uncharacterized nucleotidyltransferase DUF6036